MCMYIPRSTHTYLGEEDAVEEEVGLLLVFGDVCIGVHAKHLGMGDDGEGPHILHVALVLGGGGGEEGGGSNRVHVEICSIRQHYTI